MNLEAFLLEAGQTGALESQGAFTANLEQMIDRLGTSLLLDPSLAPLVAVAAAVGLGARGLDMVAAKRELVFRFAIDEPCLGNDGTWDYIQSGSAGHLLLAAAVWRKQSSQVSLVFPGQGRRIILTPQALRFESQTATDGPVMLKVAGKVPSSQALEVLMLRHCGLCSVPLSLQGKALHSRLDPNHGSRWSAGVPPHLCPPAKCADLAGELGLWIAPTKQRKPPWVAVVGGVSYPFLLPEVPGVRGIVWSQKLNTDLSLTGVVWDRSWTEVRSELLRLVALADLLPQAPQCPRCLDVAVSPKEAPCRGLEDRLLGPPSPSGQAGSAAIPSGAPSPIHWPEQESYQREMAGFNTAYQHSPGVVVAARDVTDLVETVAYARQHGLKIAIFATGHGVHQPIRADILISMRAFDKVRVDPSSAIATVGAGATWGSVFEAAEPYGLTPVAGSSPSVGVVGYLLGGGLGPLARSHGFSSDYLEELIVVSGEGCLIRASSTENPELFWALRGGKSGLGVVLEVRLRLVSLPNLQAGRLSYTGSQLNSVMRGWISWTATAHQEVSTSLAYARRPSGADLCLRLAYTGSKPNQEALGVLSQVEGCIKTREPQYLSILHQDPTEPSPFWVSGMFFSHLDDDFVGILNDQLRTRQTLVGLELRHLGGATQRDVPEGSAVGGRDAQFAAAFVWSPDVDLFEDAHTHSEAKLREALRPWMANHTNINFAARLRDQKHFDSAWPQEIGKRLVAVRKRYDPDGVFQVHGF